MQRDAAETGAARARPGFEPQTAASNGHVPGRSAVMRGLSAVGVVVPHGTPWRDLTNGQRAAIITRGAVQFGLLAAALLDLRRRPADQIRGHKAVWVAVSGVNYLGLGPIVYFAFGRRSSQVRH